MVKRVVWIFNHWSLFVIWDFNRGELFNVEGERNR